MYINRGLPRALRHKFDKVFQQNLFHGRASKSGNGSSIEQTHEIAQKLPSLINRLKIQSFLDIPCGDLEWMSKVELAGAKYLGADIAPSLISHLKAKFPEKEFALLDISEDSLPKVDLIFCRDLLVHLSNKDISSALKNIKASQSTYLATTTFVNRETNIDLPMISRGVAWRTLNLQIQPFNFPEPIETIDEKCTENKGVYSDKAIAIWKIKDLF
jgi:SAM-dependent methyltransferase